MKRTTLSYLVEDYGDPDVGLFGTTFTATVTLDGELDDDSIELVNDNMKVMLAELYDNGTKLQVFTQKEIEEREKEYEEMIQWEQEMQGYGR